MAFTAPEGEVSQWNEAQFFMMRLHELQSESDRCYMNLKAVHPVTGLYNWEVWYRSVIRMFSLCAPKYKEDEKEEIKKIREKIDFFWVAKPIMERRVDASYSRTNSKEQINEENFIRIRILVELMEERIKYYNEKHGLTTMNKESMDGRSILR